ncbi:MFS transporter [Algihabitans albus]|uniref:MFS transporter n=1 Tax=Algihabitans albus TaxID=2164067 RepID=UPI001ABC0A96|nr:MFS transporter [Algihabitans albus]
MENIESGKRAASLTVSRDALIHVVSLSASKVADGFVDPKLVLSWLLNAMWAPGAVIGALVPIREAGALLPQLALAPRIGAARLRKLYWTAGSVVQGLAAIGIAAAALLLEGTAAWVTVLVCLAALSIARSACSLSYKDALARTVEEGHRGRVMGAASSVGALLVFAFGAALASQVLPLTVPSIGLIVCVAGALWLGAAGFFVLLREPSQGGNAVSDEIKDLFAPLFTDGQLARLVVARGLLTATALAPPFIVMLSAAGDEQRLGQLGPLVLASAAASIVSAYLWGQLSDRSSRRTLMLSGVTGAIVLGICATTGYSLGHLGGVIGSVCAIFTAQIAYEGVRSGRKTHMTDMASDDLRARYTALSNTAIGVLLLLGGGFGLLADVAGVPAVLAVFALLCAFAVPVAASLNDVQRGE